jgi:hypothetical protein
LADVLANQFADSPRDRRRPNTQACALLTGQAARKQSGNELQHDNSGQQIGSQQTHCGNQQQRQQDECGRIQSDAADLQHDAIMRCQRPAAQPVAGNLAQRVYGHCHQEQSAQDDDREGDGLGTAHAEQNDNEQDIVAGDGVVCADLAPAQAQQRA